ncbi:MAG: XRE family transcriptional regulator [Clostridia bacterium]|nr:XRE family transcriptional regulator [Clostridia bacterium]
MVFGTYFRRCREEHGLTQEELVAKMRKEGCSITLSRYKLIERGMAEPFLADALTMSNLLLVTIDELTGDFPAWCRRP